MSSNVFTYFVIGIAKLLEQPNNAPTSYPEALLHSLHRFALDSSINLPTTLQGIKQICEKPVGSWCNPDLLDGFEAHNPLIEEGELSEAAVEYISVLETDDIYLQQSHQQLERTFDNRRFKKLFLRLRTAHAEGSPVAQTEYKKLRRFIIENPYVSFIKLQKVFRGLTHITPTDVQDLYQHASDVAYTLVLDPKKPVIQNCSRCGIVQVKHGIAESLKPSVCGRDCPKYQNAWEQVTLDNNPLILRTGIQLRTLIPGVPELKLYKFLQDTQLKHPAKIRSIELWPEIDTYDIAIYFTNGTTWVVDVKDHQDPYLLRKNLHRMSHAIDWTDAFYVYPVERDEQIGYRDALRGATKSLPNTRLVNTSQFVAALKDVLNKMEGDQ